MSIIAWIILGLAAGLLANMLVPGKRSQGLIMTCAIVHLADRDRGGRRLTAGLPPGDRAVWPARAPLMAAGAGLPVLVTQIRAGEGAWISSRWE